MVVNDDGEHPFARAVSESTISDPVTCRADKQTEARTTGMLAHRAPGTSGRLILLG